MEKPKSKLEYDRGVVFCIEDEEAFSFFPFDMQIDGTFTFADAMKTAINVEKKIGDLRWSTPVTIKVNGKVKTFYYFARVEKGLEQFRLDAILRQLNNEIAAVPFERRMQVYRDDMVYNWFERISREFLYERRDKETKTFQFRPWSVGTRSGAAVDPSKAALTEDQSAPEMDMTNPTQRTLRPRKKIAQDIAQESLDEVERLLAQKDLASTSSGPNPSVAGAPFQEAPSASSVETPGSLDSLSATNVLDQAIIDISQAEIHDIPSSVFVTAAAAAPSTTFSTTFMEAARSESDKNQDTAGEAGRQEPDNVNFTFNEGNQSTTYTASEGVILDFGSTDPTTFVTKSQLDRALNDLYTQIYDLIQLVLEDADDKHKKLDKKLDNKFANVLDIKREVKGMSSKLVGVTEQVARNSPQKSLSLHIQTNTRGRYILLRLVPFNYMGKACDVFFSSPFVQEQMCAFLVPFLHKMQFSGINFALAKTCAITFFTPLARAHLIYGKGDNSMKNLMFCKRAIPDGLHQMVDKYLVLAIEEMFNLAAQVHRSHITDMRQTCTTAFSTDRSKFLQLAVDSSNTVAEAAIAAADEDFKFYEFNKHQLKKNMKIPTFAEHVRYLLERSQFTVAKTAQNNGTFKKLYSVDKDNIFDEMKKNCIREELEIKEVLRRICAAAHCFNLNFRNLTFDSLITVPELPQLYADVCHEIGDNINDLLVQYSSEGVSYQPEVFLGATQSPTKAVKSGKKTSGSSKKASAIRSLDNELLTESEDDDAVEKAKSLASKKRVAAVDPSSDDDFQPAKKKKSPESAIIVPPHLNWETKENPR